MTPPTLLNQRFTTLLHEQANHDSLDAEVGRSVTRFDARRQAVHWLHESPADSLPGAQAEACSDEGRTGPIFAGIASNLMPMETELHGVVGELTPE
jgi:hypothetical protein